MDQPTNMNSIVNDDQLNETAATVKNVTMEATLDENIDDTEGLNFIRTFIQNEKLNDYLNAAVDEIESANEHVGENLDGEGENETAESDQENFNPNSRYVQKFYVHYNIHTLYKTLTLSRTRL